VRHNARVAGSAAAGGTRIAVIATDKQSAGQVRVRRSEGATCVPRNAALFVARQVTPTTATSVAYGVVVRLKCNRDAV